MVREWYVVVGNGTVREWHDMVREWHGTGTGRDGYDTAWYSTGMIWYGTSMVRYGTNSMARYRHYCVVWDGPVWHAAGMVTVRYGTARGSP